MEITTHQHGTGWVLVVTGRVTAEDASALKSGLLQELQNHAHRLTVDLSAVEFMGSAGLGALITAVKEARGHAGELVLAAPSTVVQTLLNVSGLLSYVTCAATIEDAVRLAP